MLIEICAGMSVERAAKLIVVLGMHRSGTSVITRGLQVLGVDLGDRLMPPAHDNEKGFWEDLDINALNIALLEAIGHDWHTLTPVLAEELTTPVVEDFKLRALDMLRGKLSAGKPFGLKDPRIPRLLPFWQDVFAHLQVQVSYVIACRNPMSVARSLAKRDNFDLEKGYYLWLEHMLFSLTRTVDQTRIVVDYDSVMEDPANQLRRIAQSLGLTFNPESQQFDEYRNHFLADSLRHTRYQADDLCLDKAVPPSVSALYKVLVGLAADAVRFDGPEVVSLVGRVATQFHENYAAMRYLRSCEEKSVDFARRLAECAGQVDVANQALAEREGRIASLAQAISERDGRLIELGQTVTELEGGIAAVLRALTDNEEEMHNLAGLAHEWRRGEGACSGLVRAVVERNNEIAAMRRAVRDREEHMASLSGSLLERNAQLDAANQALAEREGQVAILSHQISVLKKSASWRVTVPLRFVGDKCKSLSAIRYFMQVIMRGGRRSP